MVDIGKEIREELLRQERTVSWLAKKLSCTRMSVYRMMNKNSLDTGLLMTVSQILKRDFFSILSEEAKQRLSNPTNDKS